MTPEDDLWPSHLHPMYNPHEYPCLQTHTHRTVYFLHQFRTYPLNVSNGGSDSRVFGLLAHVIGLSYHGCLLSGVFCFLFFFWNGFIKVYPADAVLFYTHLKDRIRRVFMAS